ncbi:hypothetical protein AWU82_28380 [Pseudomonas glycinae]|uniref:Uncharacterized protein n=1 Tax=Pseudomonas glycinae TaxID=1785145 RepID=A0ABM6QHG7_9PSED|nr:hypothetical protein AWU82_28380 [Pseudomonas glycinae]
MISMLLVARVFWPDYLLLRLLLQGAVSAKLSAPTETRASLAHESADAPFIATLAALVPYLVAVS